MDGVTPIRLATCAWVSCLSLRSCLSLNANSTILITPIHSVAGIYLLVERIYYHICRLQREFLLLRQAIAGLENRAGSNKTGRNSGVVQLFIKMRIDLNHLLYERKDSQVCHPERSVSEVEGSSIFSSRSG